MKRMRWLALGTAALAAATLAGCSSSGSSGDATAGKDLTVWVMGDSSAHFDALVKPFEEKSGIDVKTVAIPWDNVDQKFTTAVASGDGPDVVQIGLSKLRTYADSGALMTLDDATLGDYPNLAASNFVEGVAGDATAIGGKVVSVPWVSDTRVLFYRSDILGAAGIDAPPATWDELRADAKKLTARGNGSYGYYIPQWDSALPVIMTWDQGGEIVNSKGTIDFDSPEFEKAVDLYTGLYADKSVPTNSDFDQTQGFVTGTTPMLVSGPYLAAAISQAAPELAGKWNVTTVPAAEKDTSLLAGSNLGVWGSTKNKAGALQLLDYLSQPDVQVKWYESDGQLPTVTKALEDEKLSADPMVAVYTKQLASSRLLPLVPNWDGETGKALLDSLNSIVLTGANRDETLKNLFTTTSGTSAK
ncbi:carbohydrate ABC transporter substrate-binding protein, CUT1 family [Leifsonia sp. 98AMF]|uniref:extracellular solute-binding protein n=1 Tax=unclassified Leifsonia TaxID=2663824 RepID=UPI00087DE3E3|nr:MULTISPECIES: extracellular solute-binding protein [unclassified Leifsonia]SDH08053.1 carbohydrate ABC transporter substrate-binding protein, CUT1 family [Leifsonia sp. 197AMF]SDJ31910.1 carbohydrate ABC transporter substrate-binding protein, CUT1 family [Leifsonia sp. 466MF]SDK48088.1 carbohydrate ABC transporter substrate-binding protein, CUT1 family [Leifsonia sp. 157MF]SDN53180.1 carbohydrate ABC transporter substrate-binding protein, CUT1 family [Leifsonia sp. 509MF]SEN56950.1 carbohyd